MVERTHLFNVVCQFLLFLGLVVSVFPFFIVVIAATHNLRDVNLVPMPLWPGHDFLVNFSTACGWCSSP